MLERVRLGGGLSGSYRLRKPQQQHQIYQYQARRRSSDLARDKKARNIPVTVLFLDDTAHAFPIDVRRFMYFLLEAPPLTTVFPMCSVSCRSALKDQICWRLSLGISSFQNVTTLDCSFSRSKAMWRFVFNRVDLRLSINWVCCFPEMGGPKQILQEAMAKPRKRWRDC